MKKKEGFSSLDLFALGFGAIIGVGWSITLHRFLINGGGPIPTIVGFALSVVLFIPIALVFAELSSAIPIAGGVVTYAKQAYGNFWSFVGGWFILMSYLIILPFEAIGISEILATLIPVIRTGPILYNLYGSDIYLYSVIASVVPAFIIIMINRSGTNSIAKFQTSLTMFLIVTAALTFIVAMTKANVQNLTPIYSTMEGKSHTSFITGVIAVFALTPNYFTGFDTIPQSVEEAGGVDKKSIGRIVVMALVFAGIFYVAMIFIGGVAIPWKEFVKLDIPVLSNLMNIIYPNALGKTMYYIMLLAAMSGLFTTWNSFYVAGARLVMSLGRYRYIPAVFAKTESKHNTPYVANTLCAVLMLAGPFLGANALDLLTTMSSLGCVVGWAIACLAFIRLRKISPDMPRPYKVKNGNLIAAIGAIVCILCIANCLFPFMPGYMTTPGIVVVVTWSALGIIFYFFASKRTAN